jgi:pyruvate dehydrogenase (quinone)
MAGCDTLLTIGASFPYTQFLPKFGQARAVQIDRDARIIGMRYPNEVNLVGDARATLTRLIPRLKRKRDQSWRQQVERSVTRWWKVMESQEQLAADPINPQLVFGELSRRMPDNAILAADSGSAASWYARHLKFPAGVRGSLSGSLGTMGPGVPYAIGAKFGHPDRPAIALVGDGAMQMNGLNELITIGKYWTEWDDPRLIVAVLNNRGLSQVSWETRAAESAPKFAFAQHLPDVPYAGYALSLGLGGERVEKPDDIGGAWDRALAADRPCVLEFVTDPAVPPDPPREPPQELLRESAG